jgi:DNA repair protein RecO (recombination protein O)
MKWSDDGFLLKSIPFSEHSRRLSVMTRDNGRQTGLYRFRKNDTSLQTGDLISVIWSARLSEHLGRFQVERNMSFVSRLMDSKWKLLIFQYVMGLMDLLPERNPYPEVYDSLVALLQRLCVEEKDVKGFAALTLFEKDLLASLGFGLKIDMCCVTGQKENLTYISPKTGRAIIADEGRPYHHKLLPYPVFWNAFESNAPSWESIQDAFYVTSTFFDRFVCEDSKRQLPSSRVYIVEYCIKKIKAIA